MLEKGTILRKANEDRWFCEKKKLGVKGDNLQKAINI